MTYEAEPEVLDPEVVPDTEAAAPVPEVEALVVGAPLVAGTVVELPPVPAEVVPAAVVEAPEAALVSPVKQLLLAADTFQEKTKKCGNV